MRKKIGQRLLVAVSLLFICQVGIANPAANIVTVSEPENLDTIKTQLVQYHDSGAYLQGISAVIKQAEIYLQQRVAVNRQAVHPQKLAVVLDIDETSLSNYQALKALRFGGSKELIDKSIENATDPAIAPTLALYHLAQQDKLAVFFITGRREKLQQATVKNLQQAGYIQWAGLSFKPDNYKLASIVPYKAAARAAIEKQGYDIVVNIGDQYSDLAGGYADKGFKLPDPYYFIA